MSEKPSEYLKRTCLICGCHTNQTINIYEPRAGPNIVQLIQAKFKFQPLNEDKYLCFSCNNWLINWHSLQALNSNDAESPSGTFRSHINGGNNMVQEREEVAHQKLTVVRPVAKVRPWQLTKPDAGAPERTTDENTNTNVMPMKPRKVIRAHPYSKKTRTGRFGRRSQHRTSRASYNICEYQLNGKPQPRAPNVKRQPLKNINSVIAVRSLKTAKPNPLVNSLNESEPKRLLPTPRLDGKVVAMLRRVGTTLSRESSSNNQSKQFPPIMSPTKQPKSKIWSRELKNDEILLDFDTAISEAYPMIIQRGKAKVQRELTYQISETDENAVKLPIGLTITLA